MRYLAIIPMLIGTVYLVMLTAPILFNLNPFAWPNLVCGWLLLAIAIAVIFPERKS